MVIGGRVKKLCSGQYTGGAGSGFGFSRSAFFMFTTGVPLYFGDVDRKSVV